MRHYDKNDKYDRDYAKKLKAEPWMLELIKLNKHYTAWGCFEDYMYREDAGWESRSILQTFDEMWGLDDLNECVNYYFNVTRAHKKCVECNESGYNPETKKISDTFYDFEGTGNRWCDKITQDEVEALVKHGRLRDVVGRSCYYDEELNTWIGWENNVKIEIEPPTMPLAEDINENERTGMGHDAIDRAILIETRAKRLRVFGYCEYCKGNGYIYTSDTAKLGLQLWILHPRKGCSKGVYIENIKQEDLPKVKKYLLEARDRLNNIFKNVEKI